MYNVIPSTRNEVDLFDFTSTKKYLYEIDPDIVINAAAKVGGIHANNTQRMDFVLENLKINMNILEACVDKNNIAIINLGSSCIYPLNAENPIKETSIMNGKLEPTNSPYAMAKLTAIEIGNALSIQYGHKIINLMPTNLYGPNDNFHPTNSHVIPGLISKFHNGKINNQETVQIWGDGSPLREFLYVDDLSHAISYIIENDIKNSLMNVGSSEEVSILSLAEIIKDVVGFEGVIAFDKTKPNGNNRKLLDSSLINSFGWRPKIGLNEGLHKTYSWYLKNYDNLRV
jgi:GDP-L-fucose synthase